ncbi:TPA: AAA family ATPase [Campylobacter jejuni]|nr:AAA family ATPase [Campylobacter jejuni]HDZ5084708.1 AAA family ATPase [Campylobacter jejuni]HDZ5097653.1 AAA family ATPase [Campylobacter jejuni]HDZ5107578.1 AAA family ATPase [Campylobacter jejuni]
MIDFSNEEKSSFLNILKDFINRVEEFKSRRTIKGSKPSEFKEQIDNLIQNFNYVCSVNFGSGNLGTNPAINFFRKDILHKDYTNGEIPSQKCGMYIWFSYGYKKKTLNLRFNAAKKYKKEKFDCKALEDLEELTGGIFDNIDSNYACCIENFEAKNFDEHKEKLYNKFFDLVKLFNKFPKEDFKLYESENMQNKIKNKEQLIDKERNKIALNQILYGPPGTGKTYHTIDRALEILGENSGSRDEKKAKFDEYVKNGQIVFTTFHQSYGYEEFVEGIKPVIDSEKENSKEMEYEIKDGIFKELCEKALENRDSIKSFNSYIDDLKEKVKENGDNLEKYFQLPNTKYSIQYRGGKTFRIKFDGMSKNHRDYPVSIDNIEKLYKTSSIDEVYNSAYVRAILNYLKSQGLEDYKEKDEKTNLPYIIIIDEINRGNVSKIFGELITLIEPSKRIGEKEELKVTLPYSGEEFGVSKNVYIIGTMNTADRSITSLDTALRRRFEFVEMMPDPKELENVNYKDVDLQELLTAINTRIEYLLDREKTIGHAFFIGVENLEDLKKVFQNKIISLLQEYFYNDYALIKAVLNDNGMIFEDKKDDKYLQKIKNLDNVDSERNIYKIAPFDDEIWDNEETYQAIYDDEIK